MSGHQLRQQRPTNRQPLDAYETPAYVTQALMNRVGFTGPILEPAAGTGRIARVLRLHGYKVETDDIRRGPKHDFLMRAEPCTNVVTNPPYAGRLPFQFVEHALHLASGKVAMLLKHGFFWSQGRRDWLNKHRPSDVIFMSQRILFLLPDGRPIKGQFFDHMWVVWEPLQAYGHAVRPPVQTRLFWS